MTRIKHVATPENSVDLTAYAALIAQDKDLAEQIKKLETERASLRAAIESAIDGKEYATVNGKPVVQRRASERFAIKALTTAHPEFVEPYTHEVVKEEFDFASFYRNHPDIAEQYRVYSLVNL